MANPAPHIVVVGAGIVGATVAWYLARAGARVTILDDFKRASATAHSWGWINAMTDREDYFRLRSHAMAEWRRLKSEVSGLPVHWPGALVFDRATDELEALASRLKSWNHDIRCIDGDEVKRLEPALEAAAAGALYAQGDGAAEGQGCAKVLLAEAMSLGASFRASAVKKILIQGSRAVGVDTTEGGAIGCDIVVIAAGIGASELARGIGVSLPITLSPALAILTHAISLRVTHLLIGRDVDVRQLPDGRLLATVEPATRNAEQAAQRALASIKGLLPGANDLRLDSWLVVNRPMLVDGLPAIGCPSSLEDLHFAVTHSGITLAPSIGALLSDSVMLGTAHPLLAPFSVQRFQSEPAT